MQKNKEKTKTPNKGQFMGLVPLLIFLVLYMLTGLVSGNFENMPLMIGDSDCLRNCFNDEK